mgnify:CR=1 FL=1
MCGKKCREWRYGESAGEGDDMSINIHYVDCGKLVKWAMDNGHRHLWIRYEHGHWTLMDMSPPPSPLKGWD